MSIEAMKQALEALESSQRFVEASANAKLLHGWGEQLDTAEDAITSLRQAIAEAEKQVSYSGNGTAGRENMTAPTGFFFQMPKAEKQEPVGEIYGWHGKSQSLCRWFVPEKNLPVGTKLYVAYPEPELNPVAWHEPSAYGNVTTHKDWALANGWQPLYTHPQPKREWVGLTDEEMPTLVLRSNVLVGFDETKAFIRTIETKLKQKNGYAEEKNT